MKGFVLVDGPGSIGGGRFKPYVQAIVAAERQPIKQIEARKSKEAERLKLLQEFMGKCRKMRESIAELDNFRKFRELKADLGENANLLGLAIDKDVAETGEYQMEIVQLAGRHSMISNGFSSPEDEVGVGFFQYELPNGESRSVYVDSDSNTLKNLVTLINREKDLGLQANLVNDGSGSETPWRIIVAGRNTGMDEDIIYPEFYFVDGDIEFAIDDERAAQSAIVKLNGFEILTPKNKVADLLPGVTMDLKQAKEGYEFTVNITEDVAKIAGKLKGLVDNINAVLEFINKQNQLDEKSDTSRTLGGDGVLRNIEIQLRGLILTPFNVGTEDDPEGLRASDLGIQFQRSGLLNFDGDKFQKRLAGEFDKLAKYFVGPGNFMERLRTVTDGLVGVGSGVLLSKERGMRDRMRQMDDQIARKEDLVARKEDQLKAKFGALEAQIQGFQQQQAQVAQTLGGGSLLPGL